MSDTLLSGPVPASSGGATYEYKETRDLVALVQDAAERIAAKGEAAFREFRVSPSHWRRGETYIFVLTPRGRMLVHPDPALEGREVIDLRDVNGKPIIRGLIDAATTLPDAPGGWFHYQWPAPDRFFPRWKSSYVQRVTAPSRDRYIVGCGLYNDRMERAFVVDMVQHAVGLIEKWGKAVFPLLHDPKGPFIAKDAYVFVYNEKGVNLVLPAFPNLEGRNLLHHTDVQGKPVIRDMLALVQSRGAGWIDYLWPKPGESVSTQKSAYVARARLGDHGLLVGSGVYLADARRAAPPAGRMSAAAVMSLVREAATLLEQEGERAYSELRRPGSKWFHDDTYFFVMTMDGRWSFHAAEPADEGRHKGSVKDILGRPIHRMIFEAVESRAGEGWVHYMYPRPGDLFPAWKSTFAKRVTFPSGKNHVVCCGVYEIRLDRALVEDVVHRAAGLVAEHGRAAFPRLRDHTGPFRFMDTHVFVLSPRGTVLAHGAVPSLEGKNVLTVQDLGGGNFVEGVIEAAMTQGGAWTDFQWYKPGDNLPAPTHAFVRKVERGDDVYIVGSVAYLGDDEERIG